MSWLSKLWEKKVEPPPYAGAFPPNRFVVVRRPMDRLEYGGAYGAAARIAFEYAHPARGETVELWEGQVCRGHKEG